MSEVCVTELYDLGHGVHVGEGGQAAAHAGQVGHHEVLGVQDDGRVFVLGALIGQQLAAGVLIGQQGVVLVGQDGVQVEAVLQRWEIVVTRGRGTAGHGVVVGGPWHG